MPDDSPYSTSQVREDFDRIALLTEGHGSPTGTYNSYLLKQLHAHLGNALEIGCGTGEFTRRLAGRAKRVTALDLSPEMVRIAESLSADRENIDYILGDFLELPLPAEGFDCIVSIATVHHLPLDQAMQKITAVLKPGGVLVIHDLIETGLFMNAIAYPVSALRRLWKTSRIRMPKAVRDAWDEHGKNDVYLNMTGVKDMCRNYLPGARIRRHLLWRYSVVWRKSLD